MLAAASFTPPCTNVPLPRRQIHVRTSLRHCNFAHHPPFKYVTKAYCNALSNKYHDIYIQPSIRIQI